MAFKKGDPNINKKGRTPGSRSYKTLIQESFVQLMESKIKVGKEDVPYFQVYLDKLKQEALNPNSYAFKFLADKLLTGDVLDDIDNRLNRSKREDEDFLQYRIYKSCHDYQQKVLTSMERLILLLAGRRSGKSEAEIRKVVSVAVRPNTLSLFIGLSVNRCLDVFWNETAEIIKNLGFEFIEFTRADGRMKLSNGSEIHFKGNSNKDERDKLRGSKWDLVVVDEVQSQKSLAHLLEEVIEPTLMDRKGQLILAGTGPKIRGTHWETIWTEEKKWPALRLNWNLSNNPFILDYEKQLDEIKEKKGLTDSSPLFIREYLGRICYDDDAMVFRLDDGNYFKKEELITWINSQPIADVKISAGLDYGFNDADGIAIVMYSENRPEIFLIWEYKANRSGITEVVEACKRGIEYVRTEFPMLSNKHFYFYADTGGAGKKISFELATQYGLPVLDAFKADKDFAVELLQEQCRKKTFKCIKGGHFDDESLKTIFKRDDDDNLTRVVDDDAFHPDLMDALLYALRPISLFVNNR